MSSRVGHHETIRSRTNITPTLAGATETRTWATYAGYGKANGPVICINIVRLCWLCNQAGTDSRGPVKMSTALQYCSLVAPINLTTADLRFTINFRGAGLFLFERRRDDPKTPSCASKR